MQEGKLDAAVEQFRRALQLNPTYPEAHQNLGKALFRQGRLEEAEAELQKAAHPR